MGVRSYYDAALSALRFLEHRAPTERRFGQDADLRWSSFEGHLQAVDRIDLLLRDADAQWPGSMGARRVFDRRGVAEDDAFGPQWPSLDPVAGAELWREVQGQAPPSDLAAALKRIADAWKLRVEDVDHQPVSPSTRIVVAGASAIAKLAQSFEGRTDLDWGDQVAVVASDPGTRQLAAFCGAALNVTNTTPILLAAEQDGPSLAGYEPFIGPDAAPADAAWAKDLTER